MQDDPMEVDEASDPPEMKTLDAFLREMKRAATPPLVRGDPGPIGHKGEKEIIADLRPGD